MTYCDLLVTCDFCRTPPRLAHKVIAFKLSWYSPFLAYKEFHGLDTSLFWYSLKQSFSTFLASCGRIRNNWRSLLFYMLWNKKMYDFITSRSAVYIHYASPLNFIIPLPYKIKKDHCVICSDIWNKSCIWTVNKPVVRNWRRDLKSFTKETQKTFEASTGTEPIMTFAITLLFRNISVNP